MAFDPRRIASARSPSPTTAIAHRSRSGPFSVRPSARRRANSRGDPGPSACNLGRRPSILARFDRVSAPPSESAPQIGANGGRLRNLSRAKARFRTRPDLAIGRARRSRLSIAAPPILDWRASAKRSGEIHDRGELRPPPVQASLSTVGAQWFLARRILDDTAPTAERPLDCALWALASAAAASYIT